ncbi:MAG TPA: hypothetical protein VHE83_15190 [Mycobacteriales bacterium]|nr:hypothetical protein [Mycobacteriales bacterium]
MSLRAVPAPAADAPGAVALPDAVAAETPVPTPDRYRYTVRRRLAEQEAEQPAVPDEGTGAA